MFVEGIELYGKVDGSEKVWNDVAMHVGTKSCEEVKGHAQYYLMSLQSRNPEIVSKATPHRIEWTESDNEIFEKCLAQFEEGDPDRFDRVACAIPGKTAGDVQEWYELLLGDMLDIERGAATRS